LNNELIIAPENQRSPLTNQQTGNSHCKLTDCLLT